MNTDMQVKVLADSKDWQDWADSMAGYQEHCSNYVFVRGDNSGAKNQPQMFPCHVVYRFISDNRFPYDQVEYLFVY